MKYIMLPLMAFLATSSYSQTKKDSSMSKQEYPSLKLIVTSILVTDQAKALKFYTEKLGFIKKTEIPAVKWLTVVPADNPGGVEILLEPLQFPPAISYQKALYEAGIPATTFGVNDIHNTVEQLVKTGVVFKMKPTDIGTATIAMFDDTCGNLIQIAEKKSR